MLFSRVTVEAVETCIAAVNPRYEGNVMGEWQRRGPGNSPTMLNQTGTRWRGRIMVRDSFAPGARRSRQGRRMPAACWHAIRDVLAEILRTNPTAKLTTSLATYTASTWEERYPPTGAVNIGSVMQPRYMTELCDCGEGIRSMPFAVLTGASLTSGLAVASFTPLAARIPGRCVTCKMSTYSPLMAWCSKQCHDAYMRAPDKETMLTVS